MEIKEITVSAGRTFNHPFESFSNLRPGVTIRAEVASGEDPTKVINELQALAEKTVEDHKQALLHSLEELHYLTEAQREMTSLGAQIARSQAQLEQIRKAHPQLNLPLSDDIPERATTDDGFNRAFVSQDCRENRYKDDDQVENA
jgi:hypothetical protein